MPKYASWRVVVQCQSHIENEANPCSNAMPKYLMQITKSNQPAIEGLSRGIYPTKITPSISYRLSPSPSPLLASSPLLHTIIQMLIKRTTLYLENFNRPFSLFSFHFFSHSNRHTPTCSSSCSAQTTSSSGHPRSIAHASLCSQRQFYDSARA